MNAKSNAQSIASSGTSTAQADSHAQRKFFYAVVLMVLQSAQSMSMRLRATRGTPMVSAEHCFGICYKAIPGRCLATQLGRLAS
jgi:hypothetical protein